MDKRKVDIGEAFREGTPIDEAIAEAGRGAATLHKKLGLPLVIWRGGGVVHVPPEEIDVEGWSHQDEAPDDGDVERDIGADRL